MAPIPVGIHGNPATGGDQVASHTASDTRTFPTHGVPPVIFTCPATSSFAPGEGVPIPTFPAERIRTFSVLFVLNTRSIASVVPRKFVPATVPEFPIILHIFVRVGAALQDARPVASEINTLPSPGDPPVILTCPATSSFAPGDAVPIPTLVPLSKSWETYIPSHPVPNLER